MALDGLEQWIKSSYPDGHKVHFVRYADDFIVTCENKELLETHIKPAIENSSGHVAYNYHRKRQR